jgi:hypothetical protein
MLDIYPFILDTLAEREGVDLVTLRKGQRKDDIAKEYLARFDGDEGVLFIGKAQEKAKVIRTERRYNPTTGAPYAWLVPSTSMVNQYYFYCVDKDFGPFFIKFCSYFPYNGKLCINGHEYLKRQLLKRRIPFEALDNGILSCADPKRAQKLADELTPQKIERLARKWFRKLPHPFPGKDRGEATFEQIHRPSVVDDQRASALRLDDARARALLAALLIFHLLPRGFTNQELREHVAPLLGFVPSQYTRGKMSHDLRRLRLHGLIVRIPGSRRYRVTDLGFRAATFLTRAYNRLLRHGIAVAFDGDPPRPTAPLRAAFENLDRAVDALWAAA